MTSTRETNPTTGSLDDLARRIQKRSKTLGFALMQANYVERDALWSPTRKIDGLAPEARDLSVRIRDSIWFRFESLRFHHKLLNAVNKQQSDRFDSAPKGEEEFWTIWDAVIQQQLLFDDLLFNAGSLLDYLGNAIWFGFHGQNHSRRKWKGAVRAARDGEWEEKKAGTTRIFDSGTGAALVEADRGFASKLMEFRSELIHYRIDSGTQSSLYRLYRSQGRESLRVPLPGEYSRRLKALVPPPSKDGEEPDLRQGAEHLSKEVGTMTLNLMGRLIDDLGWDPNAGLTMLG